MKPTTIPTDITLDQHDLTRLVDADSPGISSKRKMLIIHHLQQTPRERRKNVFRVLITTAEKDDNTKTIQFLQAIGGLYSVERFIPGPAKRKRKSSTQDQPSQDPPAAA